MNYINQLFIDNINNGIISDDLIYLLIENFIKSNKLEKYVLDVKIVDTKEECDNRVACYDIGDRILSISPISILKDLKKTITGDIRQNQNILQYYAVLLIALYHELVHSKQVQIIEELDNPISDLMQEVYIAKIEKNDIYNTHHSIFPIEYNANMQSYLLYNKLLSIYQSSIGGNDYTNKFKHSILSFLISKYKLDIDTVVSPVEQYNFLIPLINIDEYKEYNTSNYIKLLYGLPIEKNLYKELVNAKNSNNKQELNIKNYLKTL